MKEKKVVDKPVEKSSEKPVEEQKSDQKATLSVKISKDVPFGPKVGTRTFEKLEDAQAYQSRFGGEFV